MTRTSARSAPTPWKPRRPWSLSRAAALRIADAFRPFAARLGIDFARFRRILELRMQIEASTRLLGRSTGMSVGAGIELAGLVVALSGIGAGVAALVGAPPAAWIGIGQSFWMLMLGALTLNHFGNVLVEANEIPVVAPLPVGDRTLLAARLAHVATYVLALGACASFFPVLLASFASDPVAVVIAYPAATALSAAVVVGGVTLAYALLLRCVGAARFQRFLLWLQTTLMVVLLAGSQLGPRLWFRSSEGRVASGAARLPEWLGWLPPLSSSRLYEVLAGSADRVAVAQALAAVAAPLAIGAAALLLVSRRFVAALADQGSLLGSRARAFRRGLVDRLGDAACGTRTAAAAFGFVAAMAWREKTFVRYVLPQTAMFVAMGAGLALQSRDFAGPYVPFAAYYSVLLAPGVYGISRASEHASAAWWFDLLPSAGRSELLEGSVKALFVLVFAPIVGGIAAILWVVAGTGAQASADVALSTLATATAILWGARAFLEGVPFTIELQPKRGFRGQAQVLGTMIGFFALALALAGFHALARLHWIPHAAALALFAFLLVREWRGLSRRGA